MVKSEFVGAVAEEAGGSQAEAAKYVTAVFNALQNVLASGQDVRLPGFGTFEVRERAAREGINPRTKEPIHIPASKQPAFKPGKTLKEAVNAG